MLSAEKTIAKLTLHGVDTMTKRGRMTLVRWLRRQALALEREGDNYAGRFTARYITTA